MPSKKQNALLDVPRDRELVTVEVELPKDLYDDLIANRCEGNYTFSYLVWQRLKDLSSKVTPRPKRNPKF